MTHHNSLINFQTEIKLAEAELFHTATEEITARINKASKTLQQAIIGSDPQALNTDEMTKASSKRLDSMIENKIWLKKKRDSSHTNNLWWLFTINILRFFVPICDNFWTDVDQFYPRGSRLMTQEHNSKPQNHQL